jgi:hypothetical protein
MAWRLQLAAVLAGFLLAACTDPPSDPVDPDARDGMVSWCTAEGALHCRSEAVEQRCTFPAGSEFPAIVERDCAALGMRCISFPDVLGCALCTPDTLSCDGQDVVRCSDDGLTWVYVETCDAGRGDQCVNGRCVNGCEVADRVRSNIGCEYWAVDLDNAAISAVQDASMQQYAVVVSNPTPLLATVRVWRNDAPPGEPPDEVLVDETELSTDDLDVFLLDRREVDGTTWDGFDNGSHTAWTANAYKITSTAPIIAYQFNPLDNVRVFSNDASLLLPKSGLSDRYTVMGWPQTIAHTPAVPYTDMGRHLRAFLAVVGTEAETLVRVTLTADVMPLPDPPAGTTGEWFAGDTFEFLLGPYEVLNLETGSFNADFTGPLVEASAPVAVFSGSEASDVPCFPDLRSRRCCADHLEEQITPDSSAGRHYVVARTPARTPAVVAAGGDCSIVDEPEYVRILAIEDRTLVRISQTGAAVGYDMCQRTEIEGSDTIRLDAGQFTTREIRSDVVISANLPVHVGQFVASQEVTGIEPNLPGGDPVFIVVPPVQQWRSSYVFLTPSLYAFDYFVLMADAETFIELDGAPLPRSCQTVDVADPFSTLPLTHRIYRCPLSAPEILVGPTAPPPPDNVLDGVQNDGVHEIRSVNPATRRPGNPFGLVVYGFDAYVSYGYPGGLNLIMIE